MNLPVKAHTPVRILLGICFIYFLPFVASAQKAKRDSLNFFTDDSPIEMKLTTDFKKLIGSTKENDFQPATVTCHFPDSSVVTEEIRLCARGVYRRHNCYVPSIQLDFKNLSSPRLSWLGKLKLVSGCGKSNYNEQLLLKEYLVYKMYNLLTPKSFRVRLLKITYDDPKKKIKTFTQYAFVIEDEKDLAKRNKCREIKKLKINTENTNREQMTMVAMFEYMIGNTDWAVPNGHNIKLIGLKKDTSAAPFVIPYDFDYAGIVDADYAIPDENLGTKSVTERVYRGFPRTFTELQLILEMFRKQKDSIYATIKTCKLLEDLNQKRMTGYLDEFYDLLPIEKWIKSTFIEEARTH